MNAFDLTGKTAVVTGGGSGMGFGIATALAESGANIVVADYNKDLVVSAPAELEKQGYKAIGVCTDVTDTQQMQAALDAGETAFGSVDILVNNAGITLLEDILDIGPENWDRVFTLNTKAVFLCSQLFAKHLIAHKRGGNIVIVSSNAAKSTFKRQAHYNASKAAASNIAQSLAKELFMYGINANAVCPGGTDTDMLRYCMEDNIKRSGDPSRTVDDLRKTWGAPLLGRLIQPVEVGHVVAFLASEAAHIVRGQSITIDAGVTPY